MVSNFRMTIFNRTGNQVFMSNDINAPWDGKYRGREMPKEVHVVATDTAGVYQTAARWTEVAYDYVNTYYGKQAFNGYVYADFVLKINE